MTALCQNGGQRRLNPRMAAAQVPDVRPEGNRTQVIYSGHSGPVNPIPTFSECFGSWWPGTWKVARYAFSNSSGRLAMKRDDSSSERVHIAVAVLLDGDRCLVQERKAGAHLPQFWEFPGGKLRVGETPLQALIREVREETGIVLGRESVECLATEAFDYPDRKVLLHFFLCRLRTSPKARGGRWIPIGKLDRSRFPAANRKVLDYLKTLSTK